MYTVFTTGTDLACPDPMSRYEGRNKTKLSSAISRVTLT
jgi:hypothetical protein